MHHEGLRPLAARQHGLVTRDQALTLGIRRAAWYRRLRAGTLIEVHPGVAALEGAAPSRERAVLAAVLSLGPGAVASHRSAAYLRGGQIAGVDGLPAPRFQHVVAGPGVRYRVDFADPDVGVVIEVDGWPHHGTRAAFEGDRARDATLRTAGWTVLRFTWLQVTRRPGWVAAQIAAAIS